MYAVRVFLESLDSGSVPHDWQVGKVIPVFKKGSRASPSNYRPISITSVSCKITHTSEEPTAFPASVTVTQYIHHKPIL
ncbi:uncharacterized protein LOC142777374 isoform X2 [Rhipicephalus microplus]|uniref:uncharacterized protein LOC142777374 isoform X2 n=1 Tax=Rhipicephalus microplus TaxID=6941 RepID=UPI003F6C021A